MSAAEGRRCGTVAVMGPPNAGKSTLVNAAVGAKVSIVTHKVQTTRGRVTGIRTVGADQLVFIDTAGIFQPSRRLQRAAVEAAWAGAEGADLRLLLVDAARGMDRHLAQIADRLRRRRQGALAVVNKIDKVARAALLPLAGTLAATGIAEDIFYVSARTGDGVCELVNRLRARLPPGPWLFPGDCPGDLPLERLAAEITREKLFLRVHRELPYALSVETELVTEMPAEGAVRIDQVVHVARESHRPILLGSGGRTVKEVGMAARRELEAILERRVHLFLHVKVSAGWQDDPARYAAMGLDFPD